jgi:hypothetical protein
VLRLGFARSGKEFCFKNRTLEEGGSRLAGDREKGHGDEVNLLVVNARVTGEVCEKKSPKPLFS